MFLPFQLIVQGNPEVSDGFLRLNFCIIQHKLCFTNLLPVLLAEDHEVCVLQVKNKYPSGVDYASVLSVSMVCPNVMAAVYKVVSFAYMLMELHLTACGGLFMNSTNIGGPGMDSCGTPYLGVCLFYMYHLASYI